ncbi:MAG: hypothetical protein BWX87_00931 [Bacteroidetes bacterium ADurb.Bin123]|nr:MAG: hypothetical protein BWX87_00931 [Bacteroidetes bacterium ADurb.Bin123]
MQIMKIITFDSGIDARYLWYKNCVIFEQKTKVKRKQ